MYELNIETIFYLFPVAQAEIRAMFEWSYDGVNASIPRNVGPECAGYLSLKRRIIETSAISIIIISLLIWGHKRINLPTKVSYANHDRVGKRVLLIVMSLVLGIEIGFKFTSRTVVYILNPCHVTTAVQVKFILPQVHICVIYLRTKKELSIYFCVTVVLAGRRS